MQASISRRSKGVGEGSKSDLGVKVVNKIVEMIKGHTMLVKHLVRCLAHSTCSRM